MSSWFGLALVRAVLILLLSLAGLAAAHAERPCERAAPADGRLLDPGDGTLVDEARGLQWKRCSEGQAWAADSGGCAGPAAVYNWPQALDWAAAARFAGHDDWRLPAREELLTLVAPGCTGPAIDLTQFPATPAYAYWSATPFEYFERLAWAVYFNAGKAGYSPKDYGFFHIRLVRDADPPG
ncbi:DUF1566 domain-containing protein [Thiococcus pfennigii]|uniref:Lcl C-terminal domain-containing protein n=1 Tax=Thiococcus pfennigii TaxID=1057 RepID=UPI001903D52F|nr:DUF1566 domain-containing protein [Thiococcus pfennigii]